MFQTATHWLHKVLGTDAEFRPGQWQAISAIVENHERVLVVQHTGWGKSLLYFIATRLLRNQGKGPTLLISPLLSLMRNQIEAAQSLGICARTINSANSDEINAEVESDLLSGQVDLLLISPERFANQHFRSTVWEQICNTIGLVVVDEVHCISDWGHDFRPDYRRIINILDEVPPATPVLGTTATANNRVIADVKEILGKDLRVIRGPLSRESLSLYAFAEPQSASYRLVLMDLLLSTISGSGIIYCMTTRDCLRVARWLSARGHKVKPYFSQVEDVIHENREDLEQQLIRNDVKALVASVALGMGFDKPDLRFVIHYQCPGSIIGYYQQIGRAGRAIDQAAVILLHGPEDRDIQEYFIETAFPTPEHVRRTIEALTQSNTLSYRELLQAVNVSASTLDKILLHLELEGVVERNQRTYRLTGSTRYPDFNRWAEVTRQRYIELEEMERYLEHNGCLMQFISAALDDPAPQQPCGKCKNCLNKSIHFAPDPQTLAEATHFLLDGDTILFEPRKRWPAGVSTSLRGAIKHQNAMGVALCYYHDEGYGELVRKGKYIDGRFSDELVTASAKLLTKHFKTLSRSPTWVTAIPSLRRPNLVPDFAARLASALNLPYRQVIHKTTECPEQKTMQNSYQQASNLLNAFSVNGTLDGPVLLVDDMVDSKWTMTIAGHLLALEGCEEVHPFVLAITSGA